MELFAKGFPIFLLIFCRITSFFVVAPVFSSRNVPAQFKIAFSLLITFLVFMTYGIKMTIVPDANYVLAVFREVLTGLLLGFTAYLYFTVVQTAGAFMDLQMGFSMANIIDPLTGTSAPLLGNMKFMLAVLIFLSINGHHYLLNAILRSYEWIPLDNQLFKQIYAGHVSEFFVRTVADTFMLSLQMSAPIVVAMFLTDAGLGFLARTAPQYNVFVIGMPLKILIGFIMLVIMMPGFVALFEHIFSLMFGAMEKLINIVHGTTT
jgi:flagellar biosynthetic protein FliR